MERKPNFRTAQTPGRKGREHTPNEHEGGVDGTYMSCFEPTVTGLFMDGWGSGNGSGMEAGAGGDLAEIAVDDGDVFGHFGFGGWEEDLTPLSLPATAPSLTASAAPSTAAAGTDYCEGSDDADESKLSDAADDLAVGLFSQLVALSHRALRAVRHLARPGGPPLTVLSPEVNGVLEDTNTLIRIINDITERADAIADESATNSALPFLALACHQHLVALFHAICDAIYRCRKELKMQKEHHQQRPQHHRRGQHSDIGPSSVAQFVMVLQLLMHLINRIYRSVFQSQSSTRHSTRSSTGGYITPVVSSDPIQSRAATRGSPPNGGLLDLVQDLVGAIPNEHEKLRQVIHKLQTEMEFGLEND
jgi:hypothetical protein